MYYGDNMWIFFGVVIGGFDPDHGYRRNRRFQSTTPILFQNDAKRVGCNIEEEGPQKKSKVLFEPKTQEIKNKRMISTEVGDAQEEDGSQR